MDKNRIGYLASLGFARMEPEEVLKSLSELGYKAVEWTLAHFNPRSKSIEELKELFRLTGSFGIEISEVVVQQDFVTFDESARRDRIELVKECIKAAGAVGVKVLNVFTGPAAWNPKAPVLFRDIQEGQAWDMVLGAYDELVPMAEKNDVYLAVEAVFSMLCRDYYTTRVLIDHFDSPHLGVNMDPSHYVLYRNDAAWAVRQFGGKIKHVHLKDVVGVPGESGKSFLFPLLGEGLIDWKAFFQALDEVGYEGYASVEFESFTYGRQILGNDPIKTAALSMEQVERLLEGDVRLETSDMRLQT